VSVIAAITGALPVGVLPRLTPFSRSITRPLTTSRGRSRPEPLHHSVDGIHVCSWRWT